MTTTLVTTTRDRAFCFSLLERWMGTQTTPWDQWLVINDGREVYRYTMGQEVVVRDPSADTLPSICENWLAAIPLIKGDKILIAEDDDFYHPEFIRVISEMLDRVDLAGISRDVYFKMPLRRFVRMHNEHHASLACTGFRSLLLPDVERICRVFKNVFIDMILWQDIHSIGGTFELKPQPLPDGKMIHVGMKNMPGAFGLGIGHQNPGNGSTDPAFLTFREWAGPDATAVYRKVWEDHFA